MNMIGQKVHAIICEGDIMFEIDAEVTDFNRDLNCYVVRDLEDDCEYLAYPHQVTVLKGR